MTVRAFREAAPLTLTARLGSLLGAELARVGAAQMSDEPAARRLLSTARAFLLAGDGVSLPGLGRLLPAGPAPEDADAVPDGGAARCWARVLPDPDLHGHWPGSMLAPVDAFSRNWMAFVSPARGKDAVAVPTGLPVWLAAGASEGFPATVLVPVPDDPTDAFSLPWLNDVAARVSGTLGTVWIAGVHAASRRLYLGSFEHGRHVSLFSEEVPALFASLLPPDPHLPAAPRELWPLLALASRELVTPLALARRLALGETGGGVDLDAVASVVAAGAATRQGFEAGAGHSALLTVLRLSWETELPADTLAIALRRAFGRLSRELALLPSGEACVELEPLGLLLRLDEPELRITLPGGPGRATLPARSRWITSWR